MTYAELARRLASMTPADINWVRGHIIAGCGASGIKAMTRTITLAQINAVFRIVHLQNLAAERVASLGREQMREIRTMLAAGKNPIDIAYLTRATLSHVIEVRRVVELETLGQPTA